ncbi:MAG: carbohydrate ABC transporter permease [Spirochaetales bacterium]|nr:carbohydrate ABC transporter permease [Spirochaetales bacterium]
MRINKQSLNEKIVGLIMIFVAVLWLIPIYFIVINSFKDLRGVVIFTEKFPDSFNFDNFIEVWKVSGFPQLFMNSMIITVVSVLGILLFSSMAGYKLSRNGGKGAHFLILYFILVLIIPFQAIMIPLVKLLKDFSLIDNRFGMIIVYIALQSPLAIFLYHGAVKSVPRELEDSASIDGAGPIRTFFTIILPLLGPITTTIIILNALWIWNDFLMPLILITTSYKKTIPIGTTALFFGRYANKWHLGITAIFLATIPMITFYLIAQKRIIKGVTNGSIKG